MPSNTSLASTLLGLGCSPRIIRGHKVERLYLDRWIVDGDVINLDAAVERISAEEGVHGDGALVNALCALADIEDARVSK